MAKFLQLPEFEKELKKLSKKYPSLKEDVEDIKPVLRASPTGIGKNFVIISATEDIKIVKVRIQCASLRARTIRLIYAYHADIIEFMYIELYFKGNTESEDRARITQYLRSVSDKTMKKITVQLETITDQPISRSQAMEVLSGLDTFDVIIFDFEHISTVGQAFADEVFRVFHHKYPQIRLEVENMAEGVKFMVQRAQNEAEASK